MRSFRGWMASAAVIFALALTACGQGGKTESASVSVQTEASVLENRQADRQAHESETVQAAASGQFSLSEVPAYAGEPYVVVNGNEPYFSVSDLTGESFESYSELDSLGRCGEAYASIGTDLMPTQKREAIGSVKPTGWHTVKYDFVDGNYLYNRCHLIGYQLSGENANEKNLITGTRYMNTEGMLPFENMVADYVKETENHVLYRVTPVFEGSDLVASGVLMEAESVEDEGEGVLYCVYVYNVQPGVSIDYATGDNEAASTIVAQEDETQSAVTAQETTYVLNTNSKKFHRPSCSSVSKMKSSNRMDVTESRDEVIARGYVPCKNCNP
ncbi:MAG: DNA/RNA non-specific endonuclease [Clostridiales bacterium]|nr:DNA/RNA non-specific endonuclease [Clostridiales bacterium]